ncbi:endodeoxyribonuclease [Agrobacterium leguminum]|uniref:Endodeoxyribonuclease 1 n=1 Tax=Agrobacterium deltaense NCPPB 1641 TaxID=1183425 RepID=A0A1S7U2E3_9HYPH
MSRNKFEAAFAKSNPHFEYETKKFPYLVTHTYTPDFINPSTGQIFETKGRFTSADRSKHLAIKSQHPELDITLVFQRPQNKIRKGSKTSYADWCDKYGIKWMDGSKI